MLGSIANGEGSAITHAATGCKAPLHATSNTAIEHDKPSRTQAVYRRTSVAAS
jgi:hypothetical protein